MTGTTRHARGVVDGAAFRGAVKCVPVTAGHRQGVPVAAPRGPGGPVAARRQPGIRRAAAPLRRAVLSVLFALTSATALLDLYLLFTAMRH